MKKPYAVLNTVLDLCCGIMFFFTFSAGFTKLLIGAGQYGNGNLFTNEVEIIDLSLKSSKTCQNLPNFPSSVRGVIGSLGSKNRPTICGGFNGSFVKDCYAYENKLWSKTSPMESSRGHAAVSLSPYQNKSQNLFVSGGFKHWRNKHCQQLDSPESRTSCNNKTTLHGAIEQHNCFTCRWDPTSLAKHSFSTTNLKDGLKDHL